MSISTDIRQPHMQLSHFRVVGVRVNLTELSADDLRRELMALALEWECRWSMHSFVSLRIAAWARSASSLFIPKGANSSGVTSAAPSC